MSKEFAAGAVITALLLTAVYFGYHYFCGSAEQYRAVSGVVKTTPSALSCGDEVSPVLFVRDGVVPGTSGWIYRTTDQERLNCLLRKSMIRFFREKKSITGSSTYIVFDPTLPPGTKVDAGFVRPLVGHTFPFSESLASYALRNGYAGFDGGRKVVLSDTLCIEGLSSPQWRHGKKLESCLLLAMHTEGMRGRMLTGINEGYMPDLDPALFEKIFGIGIVKL